MKQKLKRAALIALTLLLVLVVFYWDLITYGLGQAQGQYKIISEARPVTEVLADESFPDSLKAKLHLIKAARQFAFDSLGLTYSDNYTSMYDQQGKPILWVVNACEPYELKNKEWTFPFLGAVSYKGFFDLDKAKAEEAIWKAQGYDTRIRTVGGWSTLGWFDDPILSNMLRRSDGNLAELIIHELTHGTLYIPDSVSFNENLATFIGYKGAVRFLNAYYGPNSPQLQYYLETEADANAFIGHVLHGAAHLEEAYERIRQLPDTLAMQHAKAQAMATIKSNLDTLQLYHPKRYQYFKKAEVNNTFFMANVRYYGSQEIFEEELKTRFDGDIRAYIAWLSQEYPSL